MLNDDSPKPQKNYAQGFTILTIVVIANLLSFFEILSLMQFRLEKDKTNLPILYFQGYTIAITNQIIYLVAGYIYFFKYMLRRQIRFYNAMININLALSVISLLARIVAIILCKRDKEGRPDFVNLETIGMIVDVVLCYIVYSWKNGTQLPIDDQIVDDIESAKPLKRKIVQQQDNQKTIIFETDADHKQEKTEAKEQKADTAADAKEQNLETQTTVEDKDITEERPVHEEKPKLESTQSPEKDTTS